MTTKDWNKGFELGREQMLGDFKELLNRLKYPEKETLESSTNSCSTKLMNGFFRDVCTKISIQDEVSKQAVCEDFWNFLNEYRIKVIEEINSEIPK